MSESAGIDSFLERAMPKPYSVDLRARVIEDVETGASRREAAERYGISPSAVVIWVQRFEETGSVAAKPSGGSISPLEQHAEFLLGLIANQPDLTLDEIVAAMRKRRLGKRRRRQRRQLLHPLPPCPRHRCQPRAVTTMMSDAGPGVRRTGFLRCRVAVSGAGSHPRADADLMHHRGRGGRLGQNIPQGFWALSQFWPCRPKFRIAIYSAAIRDLCQMA
jgi:transposase